MRLIPNWKLKNLAPRFLRQYYSTIRKEALRRLSVLERNNMIDYIDDVPKVTQARGRTLEYVKDELEELNNFLKNKFSSIKYVRQFERDMVDWAHSQQYYNITRENVRDYNMIMKKLKGDFEAGLYDSDRTTEIYNEAKRLKLEYTIDDFTNADKLDYMKKNIKALSEIDPVKNNKPMTEKELKKRVTQWKNKKQK